ncbi:MAG: radical SAM/SPASM domain-containing protein [Candidatus Omnitrophota bacterium]|jgi:radical SAM protein with 4Fe4S-binding SPASM domain
MKRVFSRQDLSKHTEQFSYKNDIISILSDNCGPKFKEYRNRLERAVLFEDEPEFPIHIDFETIFGCNIRCVMCTHAHEELFPSRKRLMEFGLFKKIIDEGVPHGLSSIGLDQEGDPLLVGNLFDFIEYAKSKGIMDIMINTNALLLDKQMTEKILHSGLTRIHFSLDAVKEETYRKIRVGSDFKRVTENIRYFCKRKIELGRRLPITRVSFVKMSHNESEIEDFVNIWTPVVDAIAIQEYNNPFPERSDLKAIYASSRVKNPGFKCTQPWFRMVVLTDGTVLPCCLLGMSLKMAVGNAHNSSIYDLWNSTKVRGLRKMHKDGRYAEHKICAVCAENFI